MTTREALQRSDGNFAAWADFKEWMDAAFARALKNGSNAVHAADPAAVSAIEGAQIPGWGGYDYSRLATSVDAMELYAYGENIPIVRSFNPKLILLTTSFQDGQWEAHRVWRELLRGTRGLILWDDKSEFVRDDGRLGDRGREAAPFAYKRHGCRGVQTNRWTLQSHPSRDWRREDGASGHRVHRSRAWLEEVGNHIQVPERRHHH